MIEAKNILIKIEVKKILLVKKQFFFDTIAILEEKKQSYQLRNGDHNYNLTLASIYLAYRKIAQTEGVIDKIGNHAKTDAHSQQILTHFCFGQNIKNPLIKNLDVYNK